MGDFPVVQSRSERELVQWLARFGVRVSASDRTLLNRFGSRFELDLFIPGHAVGVELNGTLWHSCFHSRGKRRRLYHFDKTASCARVGVSLYHHWGWHRLSSLKSVLAVRLGLPVVVRHNANSLTVVFADDLGGLGFHLFDSFFDCRPGTNWRWERRPGDVDCGLVGDDGVLLCAATCRVEGSVLTVYRYASANYTVVRGGFSRLFSHIVRRLSFRGRCVYPLAADGCSLPGECFLAGLGWKYETLAPPDRLWYVNRRVGVLPHRAVLHDSDVVSAGLVSPVLNGRDCDYLVAYGVYPIFNAGVHIFTTAV